MTDADQELWALALWVRRLLDASGYLDVPVDEALFRLTSDVEWLRRENADQRALIDNYLASLRLRPKPETGEA